MMKTGKHFKGVGTADLSTPTSTPRFITYKPQGTVRTTPTTSHDRETFRYYLSAFRTAVRSVTQYAREESRSKNREQWYEETIDGNDLLSSDQGSDGFKKKAG